MSKSLTPTGNTTGTGSDTLTLNWGKNQTRSNITKVYRISGDAIGENKLTVTQKYTALSISATGQTTKSVVMSSSAQNVTFAGKANGKYLKYSLPSGSPFTVVSCTAGPSGSTTNIGSSYTQVSAFEGGTSKYDFSITVRVAANTPVSQPYFYIYTADTNNASIDAKSQKYIVSVESSAVPLTSVSISPNPITLGIGNSFATQLSYTLNPTNASISSVVWSSTNTSVATVDQNGLVTGVTAGSCSINITVTDTYGTSRTASCAATVYAAGSISVESKSINSQIVSVAHKITYSNMDLSTLTVSYISGSGWVDNYTVDLSSSTKYIRLDVDKNNTSSNRTATMRVTCQALNGETKTTQFTLTQNAYSVDDVPCTSITVNGLSTINNSGNSAEYSVTLYPSDTTQRGVTWSITDGSGNPTQLATVTPDGLSCTVNLASGASSTEFILKATNYRNSSVYGTKNITGTYVHDSGNITVSPSSVVVAPTDTSDNSPVITTSGIHDDLAVKSYTGFIDSASISGNKVVTGFTTNSSTVNDRTGTVVLNATDLNDDEVTATIEYRQAKMPTPNASFSITKLNVAQDGGKIKVKFVVNYINTGSTSFTCYNPAWVLVGYDSATQTQEHETFTHSGTLSTKTISPTQVGSPEVETYSPSSWSGSIGMSVSYKLTLTSGSLSDVFTGDGNDEIDD